MFIIHIVTDVIRLVRGSCAWTAVRTPGACSGCLTLPSLENALHAPSLPLCPGRLVFKLCNSFCGCVKISEIFPGQDSQHCFYVSVASWALRMDRPMIPPYLDWLRRPDRVHKKTEMSRRHQHSPLFTCTIDPSEIIRVITNIGITCLDRAHVLWLR